MFLPQRPSRAFTLLELIVVIVILGVLAAIAVPSFQRVIDTSKLEAAEATLAAVARDTQALAALESDPLTYEHFEAATGELTATADAPGVSAVEGRRYHASYGIWSFSPNARTISALINTEQVMTTATFLPGVGCAWARNQATGGVETWSQLGVPEHECSGAGGDRSRKYKAPPTPTGLTVTWTAGYWKVDCTGTEPVDVYRNGKYVTTTNCPWTGGGSEDDTITVIISRNPAAKGPTGWVDGPGDFVAEGDPTRTEQFPYVNVVWDPALLPPGAIDVEVVHPGGVERVPGGNGLYQAPIGTPVTVYPIVDGVRSEPIPSTVTPTPPPSAPVAEEVSTGKRSTAVWVDGYMTVLWIPVTATKEAPLFGYRLYRQQAPGEVWDTTSIGYQGPGPRLDANGYVQVFDASEFSDRVSDVTLAPHPQDGTGSWCYRVSAYGPGGESALSERVCGSTDTIPGAPTDVTAVAGAASATVSWKAPLYVGGSPITSYRVISTPDGKVCTTNGELSCTVTGLTGGQSYTFTVRAENSFGPGDPSQPSNAVTALDAVSTVTYSTSGFQDVVVPSGTTSMLVELYGAQGGNGNSGPRGFTPSDVVVPGGKGGAVKATLAVTPGETLRVYVGGRDGFNGGGPGNNGGDANASGSGSGGGGTDIRRDVNGDGTFALDERLVVAGGGGGGGYGSDNYDGINGSGGAGGYVAGEPGVRGGTAGSTYAMPGQGGTQTAGGAGGVGASDGGVAGGAGSFATGGSGAYKYNSPGGGGGGGWYGAGGGGSGSGITGKSGGAGGGGGSSWAGGVGVTAPTFETGVRAGEGLAKLVY